MKSFSMYLGALLCSGGLLLNPVLADEDEEHRGQETAHEAGEHHDHGPGIVDTLKQQEEAQKAHERQMEAAIPPDTVVAIVNGEKITEADYLLYAQARRAEAGDQEFKREDLMTEVINRVLVIQHAEAEKMGETEEFKERMDMARRDLLSRYGIGNYLKEHPVTPEDVKNLYDSRLDELIQKMPMEYKARHILVKTREEADKMLNELKGGKDFAELAKEYSKDGGSAKEGGDLGWFTADRMVKPFAEAVEGLEKGAISEPVESGFGWHIIMLDDSRRMAPPSFEDLKDRLAMGLHSQRIQQFLDGLRANASIEIQEVKLPEAAAAEPAAPAEAAQ